MRLQFKQQAERSVEESLAFEAASHDEEYRGLDPYELGRLEFTVDEVWRINDRSYKRGTYRRGWRKRRLFELMDLSHIAGKRVLDVGCGIGKESVFYAMCGASVSGLDLSREGISVAQRTAQANGVAPRCDFKVASASDMPYPDNSFDIVVYNAVLHHAVKYPGISDETFRVLKPGGKVVLAEGLRDNRLYCWLRDAQRRITKPRDQGDVDLERWDIDAFLARYVDVHVEPFSLLESFATRAGRDYDTRLAFRAMCLLAVAFDAALLKVFPHARKSCLEIVASGHKPGTPNVRVGHANPRPAHATSGGSR